MTEMLSVSGGQDRLVASGVDQDEKAVRAKASLP